MPACLSIDNETTFGKIQILNRVNFMLALAEKYYEEVKPMKIEKVNDNQIRCTLTKADLADRELKLSEIAYGTEKAKNLFRDMMQQAALKFGFEADNIPLMIEAIPLSADCIVLIITKVEDPEELDTRFSRFAPDAEDSDDDFDSDSDLLDDTIVHSQDEVMDLFKKLKKEAAQVLGKAENDQADASTQESGEQIYAAKIFSFDSMASVIRPSVILGGIYDDKNSLFKDERSGRYMLVLSKTESSTESYNKACNILSEYGKLEKMLPTSEYYFKEHYECVIEDNAIQSLSKVM